MSEETRDFAVDQAAEQALQALLRRGFQHAQVTASESRRCELNLAHNEPSLLRSSQSRKLAASAIVDGRRASAEGSDVSADGVAALVDQLWDSARSAPRDEANAVSAGQHLRLVQGPQQADPQALAASLRELLDWRAAQAPAMMIEEGQAAHARVRSSTLTSGGSAIDCSLGCCGLSVFGLARAGGKNSSFNYAGGSAHALAGAAEAFGILRVMDELTRQIDTQPLGERFVGDVVLAPGAVDDLLGWLMGQLGDGPLIDGSSLYRERVGQLIASPLLTLHSRYDGPGCLPVSADAFVTPPATLLDAGRLTQLTPSLYGSRKTGIAHRPVAGSGWVLRPGNTPLAAIVAAVPRGALVGRLSMGDPAPNGDFSGVIKNSFVIRDGRPGPALAETMISGNVAQMLLDVAAVSAESIDRGSERLPWLRIGGLHFS
jgi:PmbA protein